MRTFSSISKLLVFVYLLCLSFVANSQAITLLNGAPYFTGPVSGVYESNLKIEVKANQTGTAYFVTYDQQPDSEPEEQEIINYANDTTAAPADMVAKGTITVTSTTQTYTKDIGVQDPHMKYYTYAVLQNSNGTSEVTDDVVHLMGAKKDSYYFYTEYLPPGYTSSGNYALMIFLHGTSESGTTITSLNKVLRNGPPKEVTVGNDFPEFIIISPQSHTNAYNGGWNQGELDKFLESLKVEYDAIDENRIYLTGLSMGGFGTWLYAKNHPEKLAAIVPISGGGNSSVNACNLVDLPIWAIHDDPDTVAYTSGTKNYFNAIRTCAQNAGKPRKANMTLVQTTANGSCDPIPKHSVWGLAYGPKNKIPYANKTCSDSTNGRQIVDSLHTVQPGSTIYSWLLQHSLGPTANAGPDITLNFPTNSVALNGSGSPAETISTYLWTKESGGQVTMANAATASLSLSNMEVGAYTFKLKVTDTNGKTATDVVTVNVVQGGPKTFKINFRPASASASPGTQWNDFTTTSTNATLSSIHYTDNTSSSYSMTVNAGFTSTNSSGMDDAEGIYPTEVMKTAWYITSPGIAQMTISGLDNSKKYTLMFFGSRVETGSLQRTTLYTVNGVEKPLDAANNIDETADFENVSPANGNITFTVKDAADGAIYGYLNALEVRESEAVAVSKAVKVNFRTGGTAAAPAPWNEMTSISAGTTVNNLKYDDGLSSTYAIEVSAPFTGSNTNGSTSSSGIYPIDVMKTAWFVDGTTMGELTLSGLDDNKEYTIKLFGSRIESGSQDRITLYTAGGMTDTLNASNNSTRTAIIPDITPTGGIIAISVEDVAGGASYGYLNALEIIEGEVVAPPGDKELKLNFRASTAPAPPSDWNDLTAIGPGATEALLYSDGGASGYTVEVTDGFSGTNANGVSSGGVYPGTVTQTCWYVNGTKVGELTLSGLDVNKTYSFEFFGSRTDAGGTIDRNTEYSINTTVEILNASNNATLVAPIGNVAPASNGTIVIKIKNAPNGETFGYLNAMKITEHDGGGSFAMMSEETQMQQTSEDNAFTIHPMPYTNRVTVTFGEKIEGKVAITLKDISGRTHFYTNNLQVVEGTSVEIDLTRNNIPRGMGVLKVQSSKGYSKTVQVYKE